MRDEIFHLNLGSIHELIAQREISVTELVQLTLERIQRVNPKINAVIHLLDKTSLRLAGEADEKLKSFPHGKTPHRLFGIPFSIKGIFAVQDQPWEVGSLLRKNTRADFTAEAVQLIINAGAIPIAITNVPEASIWIETDNLLYGKTRNPFDPKKTSGGSSGGEAALIASGGSFFGIGTDFGGSIRIPSSFCGITGHKPTSHVVSNHGQWPECPGELGSYLSVGPLTRRSEDLFPILQTLAAGKTLKDPSEIDPKKIRVLMPKTTELFLGGPQTAGLLQMTRKKLEQAGISVEIWDHPDLRRATEVWFAFVGHAGKNTPKFSEVLGVTQKLNLGEEFLHLLKGKPRHSLAPLTLAALEKLSPVIERRQNKVHKIGQQLKEALFNALGDDGVFVTTVFPRPAPNHHHTRLRPMEFGAAGLANVFEMPSSSVPMGLSTTGLPVGAMISARPGNDHLCLAIARQIEVPLTPIMPAAELLTGSILYPDKHQTLLTTSARVSSNPTPDNES